MIRYPVLLSVWYVNLIQYSLSLLDRYNTLNHDWCDTTAKQHRCDTIVTDQYDSLYQSVQSQYQCDAILSVLITYNTQYYYWFNTTLYRNQYDMIHLFRYLFVYRSYWNLKTQYELKTFNLYGQQTV